MNAEDIENIYYLSNFGEDAPVAPISAPILISQPSIMQKPTTVMLIGASIGYFAASNKNKIKYALFGALAGWLMANKL